MSGHRFSVMPGRWAIVRLGPGEPVPSWALGAGDFVSVTRTADELSVVCPESAAPGTVQAERGWAVIKLHGPFPFQAVGVLASFAAPLAAAGVSLFAISTYDTDYLLVNAADVPAARRALEGAGHRHA